jgi:integrase
MARKRGQNEGSIFWVEARRRWRASVTLTDGSRKEFQARTKPEAQAWLHRTLLALQQGTLATGPQQTVGQFLTRWLEDVADTTVKPRTALRYRQLLTRHAIPAIGKIRLAKLTPQHLQKLYADKLKAQGAEGGLGARTIRHLHRVLHHAFADAVRWDFLGRNPCDRVDPPRVTPPEMQALTAEEVCRLLHAAQGDPLEALIVLAATTGMRQGELLALKWQDVGADFATLQVRRSVCYLSGKGHVWSEPKTARSRRQIVLMPMATEALRTHRDRQALQRAFAGDRWEENDLVFTNTLGRPLIPANLYYRCYLPLLAKAGIRRVRFHDLRHSVATLLLAQGTHPKVVSELLGHSTTAITLDVYSHILPGLQEEAIAQLSQRLTTLYEVTARQIAADVAEQQAKEAEAQGHL